MPSFEDLLNASLGTMNDAVDDWSSMLQKLDDLAKNKADRMVKFADKADWRGENATVSRAFIKKTGKEFHDAHTEATSIRNILRDAHTAFKDAKTRLQSLVDDSPSGMTIAPDGTVGHIRADSRGKGNDDPLPTTEEIDAYQAKIDHVVKQATEVDASAARALRKIVSKNPYNFTTVDYASLGAADTALAKADAKSALRIARKHGRMNDEELAELDRIFDLHAHDRVFATNFYGQLGPKETLRFNAEFASALSLYGDQDDIKTAADIQKHLGTTLASATAHVGADGYLDKEWVDGLKKAGHARIDMRADGYSQAMPYGYQSLAPLLKHGDFGDGFLKQINHDMLAMDRQQHGTWPTGSNSKWYIDLAEDVDHSKFKGTDPMVGLLEANSRAPEAATDLFKNKSDLTYLLHSPAGGQRPDALGHALESAVYGFRYDQPPPTAPEHNDTQTTIMKNVIEAISKDSSLVNHAIGDSFGHMAAAYMPEINRSITGSGDFSTDVIFPTNGSSNVKFDAAPTYRFLYDLARDPDGYAAVTYAQNAYAGNSIEYHLNHPDAFKGPPVDVMRTIASTTGEIQGILGHSLSDAALKAQAGGDAAVNEAFKNQSDWFKNFASAGITTAAASYPPATIAGSTAGTFFSAFGSSAANQVIDNIFSGREIDGRDEAVFRVSHDLDNTRNSTISSTQWAAQWALSSHDDAHIGKGEMDLAINEGVKKGWSQSSDNLDDFARSD